MRYDNVKYVKLIKVDVNLFSGSSGSMPVSPLILGLLGTAGILAAGVCLVLAALCRRHYARPCHRPDSTTTKHVPMEAVIAADDLLVDGSITGVRSPTTSDATITEPLRNGAPTEGSDPDIIRNQYGKEIIIYIQSEYVSGSFIHLFVFFPSSSFLAVVTPHSLFLFI